MALAAWAGSRAVSSGRARGGPSARRPGRASSRARAGAGVEAQRAPESVNNDDSGPPPPQRAPDGASPLFFSVAAEARWEAASELLEAFGVAQDFAVHDGGPRGLGLVARRPFAKGETLLAVPHDDLIVASRCRREGEDLQGNELALALISGAGVAEGEEHARRRSLYLNALPRLHELCLPVLFDNDQLRILQDEAVAGLARIEGGHLLEWAEGRPEDTDELLRAWALVRSRCFGVTSGVAPDTVLCPVVDLVNHDSVAKNAKVRTNLTDGEGRVAVTEEGKPAQLELVAMRDIFQGEEILITYDVGEAKSPAEMMLTYGFVEEVKQPADKSEAFAFALQAVSGTHRSGGLSPTAAQLRTMLTPTASRLAGSLRDAVQHPTKRSMKFAATTCAKWLSGAPTSLAEDGAALKAASNAYEYAALLYRLERKHAVWRVASLLTEEKKAVQANQAKNKAMFARAMKAKAMAAAAAKAKAAEEADSAEADAVEETEGEKKEE